MTKTITADVEWCDADHATDGSSTHLALIPVDAQLSVLIAQDPGCKATFDLIGEPSDIAEHGSIVLTDGQLGVLAWIRQCVAAAS
jgi:hypothetical protein